MRRGAFFAATLLLAFAASAQVLYKWIDAQGRVQYSDRPPKDFKGPVTRIEPPDAPPDAVPTLPVERKTPPPKAVAPAPAADAEPPMDMAAKRRAARATLQARIDAARENLEARRKALEEGGAPQSGEQQVLQRPAPANLGKPGAPQRSNCRLVPAAQGGPPIAVCPTLVPTTEYYDRIQQLEEAVRQAERELADAERAYRRGTD